MSNTTSLYAGTLQLSRSDIKALKISDIHSLQRVVYDLFDDERTELQKLACEPSGILYADKGRDFNNRIILLLANRPPKSALLFGKVKSSIVDESLLQHDHYSFEVTVNPGKRDEKNGKIIAISGKEEIAEWFIERAEQTWGFKVDPLTLQIENMVDRTANKTNQTISYGSATLKGVLQVIDRNRFIQSYRLGIGRNRAFGFGLLQILPV